MAEKTKILVIGNANSVWIQNYIAHILDDFKYSVTVFDSYGMYKGDTNNYVREGVNVVRFPDRIIDFMKKESSSLYCKLVYGIKSGLFLRQICRNYDIINLQSVDIRYLFRLSYVRNINNKLILSYWGSDLLRATDTEMQRMARYIDRIGCKKITFDSGDLEYVFNARFPTYDGKKDIIMLPLPSLAAIDNTRQEKVEEVGGKIIPKGKIIIAIGYNGFRVQQQTKAIKALGALEEEFKRRFIVVLQMTYGSTQKYISECEKCCIDNGIDYILIRDFLSEEEIGRLRNRVDLFINTQTTDAFAGSFCEYLYADTIVFNAKWLHYAELDKYNISCVEYDDFDALGNMVEKYLESPEGLKVNREINRKTIYELRSIESCKTKWNRLFEL